MANRRASSVWKNVRIGSPYSMRGERAVLAAEADAGVEHHRHEEPRPGAR